MLLKYSSLLNFASTYEKRLDLKKKKKTYRVGDLLDSYFTYQAFSEWPFCELKWKTSVRQHRVKPPSEDAQGTN